MSFHRENGNSTFIILIGLAILAIGVPVGSYLLDYMHGVQHQRIDNRFQRFSEEEPPVDGPPEGFEPGGFTITYDL